MTKRVLVWDMPTRVFHWSLVLSFIGAFATCESERWALIHVTCGYTMLGLIVFRMVWGLVGTRYARFSEFVSSPSAVIRYIKGMVQGRPAHYVGHNPLGAIAIVALLLMGLASTVSGWMSYDDVDFEWLEELHETSSYLMLAIVFIHVAGVLFSSWQNRENLILSMISGRKDAEANQAVAKRPLVALAMLAGLIGFWLWSFNGSLPFLKTIESTITAEFKVKGASKTLAVSETPPL